MVILSAINLTSKPCEYGFGSGRNKNHDSDLQLCREDQTMMDDDVSLPKAKKHSQLTQEKFDKLLVVLDPDRTIAGEIYEHLRQAMITFFSFRGAFNPEELADETMNRVASRLHEGAEIFSNNPASYFYGFARNIWHETVTKKNKLQPLDEAFSNQRSSALNPHEMLEHQLEQRDLELRRAHLNHCLEGLSAKDRELLIEYYQDTGAAKIENRQALAERFSISPKTLRNKTVLLRGKLADCVRKAMSAQT
jgi:RNA polymerase sigma factor (sigma-70 family)